MARSPYTQASQNNYSGLVFGNPKTRSPSFHFPRRFNTSIRSSRFNTLRLAAIFPLVFKLECCDMISPDEN